MADIPPHPPTIDLDGLRLRPLHVADADALLAYLRNAVVTELTSEKRGFCRIFAD